MCKTPAVVMTYTTMVSKDTVRTALTIAALNDLEVMTSDTNNAYLTLSPCEEKIYTTFKAEFGSDAGKNAAIIVCAHFGHKSAGHHLDAIFWIA